MVELLTKPGLLYTHREVNPKMFVAVIDHAHMLYGRFSIIITNTPVKLKRKKKEVGILEI